MIEFFFLFLGIDWYNGIESLGTYTYIKWFDLGDTIKTECLMKINFTEKYNAIKWVKQRFNGDVYDVDNHKKIHKSSLVSCIAKGRIVDSVLLLWLKSNKIIIIVFPVEVY